MGLCHKALKVGKYFLKLMTSEIILSNKKARESLDL